MLLEQYPALLVSVYPKCKTCKHAFRSTDAAFLRTLPFAVQLQCQFECSHKNTLHKELIGSLVEHIDRGVPISSFAETVTAKYKNYYIQRQREHLAYWQGLTPDVNFDLIEFPQFETTHYYERRKNAFKEWYLLDYERKDKYYDYCWSLISHKGNIAADHTFKVAQKVKLSFDGAIGKRIAPFHYLYDIHGDDGWIWAQFCYSDDFEAVQGLHEIVQRKAAVNLFIVDKCCVNEEIINQVHPDCIIKSVFQYI